MSESISDIKKKLEQLTSIKDPYFQLCLQDERKGVQKLLRSVQKKWEKKPN